MSSAFRELGGDINIRVDIGLEGQVEAEQEMLALAGYFENTEAPLIAARRVAINDMKDHFDSETDPDGDKWADLDPEYLRAKLSAGYPSDILNRTGDLEAAATSEDAWFIAEDTLWFNTSVLPEYGLIHQYGSGEENVGQAQSAREGIYAQRESGIKLTADTGGVHESLGIGRGMALPRRAFIGLSEPAEAEIWTIFDKWFEDSSRVYIRESGVAQARTATGQFAKKIS